MLDANLTSPGDRYDALGETYVIFITERDVLHEGLPIYHIDRYVRETGKPFEDGSHILYVNAQCRSDTPLGKLMHDFHCTDARDMNYPVLAERVYYFKDNVKGATNMCRAVETLVDEGTKYGQLKTIFMKRSGALSGKGRGQAPPETVERLNHSPGTLYTVGGGWGQ